MYRPKPYVVDDVALLRDHIRARPFATIAVNIDDRIQFAYAPVVLDREPEPFGCMRFHLARANPVSQLSGCDVRFSFLGPHTYISPDWYRSSEMVPTWNYIAIEAHGCARPLDEDGLRGLLADLSAVEEEKLAPKPSWMPDKISPERMASLLRAISGFEVVLDGLEGKFKLSQDKNAVDFDGAVAGLLARDDAASQSVVQEMLRTRDSR